jgi:hypothetical protein
LVTLAFEFQLLPVWINFKLKWHYNALSMIHRGRWHVRNEVLLGTMRLVWKGYKLPLDCIKVRNSELAKWLPLPQGILVTVVLYEIFHRRNAVCEFVCIVTFKFWILRFLNCVDGLNILLYILFVFFSDNFFLGWGSVLKRVC